MARRRKPNRRHAASRGGVYTPPFPPAWTPVLRPLPRFYRPATRAPALDQPVLLPRTVRPALIRTVRTDTKRLWSPPNRRPSPDLPNRALARMQSWNTPIASLDALPPRAITCARRSIRRQVLLALGRGNGSGSRGQPKSKERCT